MLCLGYEHELAFFIFYIQIANMLSSAIIDYILQRHIEIIINLLHFPLLYRLVCGKCLELLCFAVIGPFYEF